MQTFPPNIRLLDIQRDLPAVADLIEVCFSNTLDPDGRDYIRFIRQAAKDAFLRRSISGCNERLSSPLAGYVWEENGVVAGNLTLIPFYYLGEWQYLIANVAVLPQYRGRGIG